MPQQHDGPLYQPFRPPAQYKETAVLPKQELLNRLISAYPGRHARHLTACSARRPMAHGCGTAALRRASGSRCRVAAAVCALRATRIKRRRLRADACALRPAARSGRWFELAKALDALHASGTPNTEVFEMTGLTPLEQNAWKVQAAVYVSLEASDDFPKPLLEHYYDEQNAASLAELKVRPFRSPMPLRFAN
jgi:hypothetical protein